MLPQRKLAIGGLAQMRGDTQLHVVRRGRVTPPPQTTMAWLRTALREGLPSMKLSLPAGLWSDQAAAYRRTVNRWRIKNLKHLAPGLRSVLLARALGIPTFYGALWLTPIFKIGTPDERRYELGLVGLKVVTNNGVGFIVDAFQNLVEAEIMKFHALGTGVTAEDVTDAALVTELTTQYTGNVRATGNLAEGASANIYHTEATNTLDETPGAALREHGVFSQAATGGGVLFDRTLYGALTLSAGDALLSKYEATFAAGS